MDATEPAQIKASVCPLDCPDTCSLSVTVQRGRIIDVKGSDANPFTEKVICNKVARYYPDFVHGDQRLRYPLKRVGPRGSGKYEHVSWDQALDLVTDGFREAIDRFGPQSVMPFNYAGPHGELAGGSMDRRFFHKLGATLLNRGPLCGAVRGSAYASLFGNSPGMPPGQAEHADLIVVWGNNVTVSNLHLIRVINRAKARGSKLIVIDPKRTKVAEQADLFVQIKPGTDVVLAMALAHEFERCDALDHPFIGQWVDGFDTFMTEARRYSMDDVGRCCGVSATQFDALADLYLAADNVAASFGNGIERGRSGGSGLRAAMALQALTGNHGRLGAGVVAKSGLLAPKTTSSLQRPDLVPAGTRTFNIVDVAEKLLDTALATPIKAIMIYNHNPVATHPDQNDIIKALSRDDLFIVGSDVVMTDSMAFADVILPAASHFEYDDIYGAYGQNFVQRAEAVVPCVGESLPNTEIFRRLAARMGLEDPIFKADDAALMDDAMDASDSRFSGVLPSKIDTSRSIELKTKDGSDPIMCANVFPATKSGKIELFSTDLEERFGFGVPRFDAVKKDRRFVLITPSSDKRTNATFGGCDASKGIEIVEMHPDDAKGFVDGDLVSLFNDRGRVTLRLKVSDSVLPGVLYSPKGTWRSTSETGMTVNALIPSDVRTDIEDGACYNETFVDVERLGADVQPRHV